jgi:hypothetical protein
MADSRAQAYAAGLFEKAQAAIGTLASIDSQINQLLTQRRDVQNGLTAVQSKINEEFGRLMRESDELPAKILSEISGSAARDSEPSAPEAAKRPNLAEAAT